MAELGGLGELFRKITGTAAREARIAAEQQRLQNEATAARTARLKLKAGEFQQQLQLATRVDTVTLPDTAIDFAAEVTEIESHVRAREIWGKFHPGVQLKGEVFVPEESSDFKPYGDIGAIPFEFGEMIKYPYLVPLLTVMDSFPHESSRASDFFKELRRKHFVAVTNAPDQKNAVISYFFLHDHVDRSGRPSGMAVINFLLEKQHAYKLLALIRKNPEVAEMFLQRAANGFERDSQTQSPGIGRIKSDEVVIVNLAQFDPDYFNLYIDPYSGGFERLAEGNFVEGVKPKIVDAMQLNAGNQIERHRYQTPHGISNL